MLILIDYPSKHTKQLYNLCIMLDQRRKRWADIVHILYKCFVLAGIDLRPRLRWMCVKVKVMLYTFLYVRILRLKRSGSGTVDADGSIWSKPENEIRWLTVGIMMDQSLRRWSNIRPSVGERVLFAEKLKAPELFPVRF